jgi:hypothetical protein
LPFWAKDYFEHRVRDSAEEQRIVRYIENNPVKAGLCGDIEEWQWSSATEVAGTWKFRGVGVYSIPEQNFREPSEILQ